MSGGSVMVFPLSKMNILRDEGGHFMFCRKQLRVLAGTLVHLFRPTSADGTSKGGVSSSILYSVCVVKAQQPKLSALGLSSAPPASLNHAPSTSRSSALVFVLVPAQTRTCGV